ncbi:hypothetical protein [Dendronalium sp. ChiSLP03b]|nr:hypothetical protein [Dendronalium sp. ChiSLP03b]
MERHCVVRVKSVEASGVETTAGALCRGTRPPHCLPKTVLAHN